MNDNEKSVRTEQKRPFTTYRFFVYFYGSADDSLKGAFTNFSGIKISNQVAKLRCGEDIRGVKDNYPGITEYEHVKLTKGVIGKGQFVDWLFHSTLPGVETGPAGKGPMLKDGERESNMYQNIRIVSMLEDKNEPGMEWILINALPVGYELHPMDSSQSAYLSEEIELAFTGVKRNSLWQGEKGLMEEDIKVGDGVLDRA